jgi:hypothetical protein
MGPKPLARTAGPQHLKIDGRTRPAFLDHDPRMNSKGDAIRFNHAATALDVDTHHVRTLARETGHGSPSAAHAAVIHGAAPTFAQRADGGKERESVKPKEVGMKLSGYKTSDHPGTNFYSLSQVPAIITDINFSAIHTVEAVIEGHKETDSKKFKTWNLTMERGGKKYVIKILLPLDGDEHDEFVVVKGSAEGFKAKNQISKDSGNLFIKAQPEHPTTDHSNRRSEFLLNAFVKWEDDADNETQFPPILAQIIGNTLTFKFIKKSEFDTRVQSENFNFEAIKNPTATDNSATAPAILTFPGSDLMRSAMEMVPGMTPALIDEALTNAYLLTTLASMGITELADQKTVIEALDLKANINDLSSLQTALEKFDDKTIPFLQEAKGLGSTELYPALREMIAIGFTSPTDRAAIVSLFDLASDPAKVMDVMTTLIEFDLPINFTVLEKAKAAGDISLYPLFNRLHTDGIDDQALVQTLISDFELSSADLKADGQPKYTDAMNHYRAFAGHAYSTDVVTEAKAWALDETIQIPDVIGVLVNFLDGKDSADKDLIYGAFMVAFSNGDQGSLTAILAFGKAYARATADQRDSARDLLSGYSEGDFSSESGKARFARLLQKQTP